MKIRLLFAFAFMIACQIAVSAQQKSEQNAPRCAGFTTPVIKPDAIGAYSPIIKPDALINYKLIIVNPCAEAVKVEIPAYEDFKLVGLPVVKTINPADEMSKIIKTFPSMLDYISPLPKKN